jgi:hypothetical protein
MSHGRTLPDSVRDAMHNSRRDNAAQPLLAAISSVTFRSAMPPLATGSSA